MNRRPRVKRSSSGATVGRPVEVNSLRQMLERGEARWLKVALPVPLARAVHVAAAESDSTPSEVIARLVREHLKPRKLRTLDGEG
jgi:hypothetical protein